MDQHEINEREWSDPGNWRMGVYSSPRDTRVWVPKQVKWAGWTLNFAHRAAYAWITALLAPALIIAVACIAASVMK